MLVGMEHVVIHNCSEYDQLNPSTTAKDGPYMWGIALGPRAFLYEDGRIGMDNDEYGVVVRYCPYCGLDLRTIKVTQ